MKLGTNDIGSVYLGSNAVQKVYLGTNEVWSSYAYLLDTYSGAAAAYSLRKLRSAYTGSAIRVRRASDNTEQDIGFVNNELDTSTLTSFCSGTNGFVKTWYDQSGNGYDASQSTAANQPQIVSSGSVILENGKPTLDFDGTNDAFIASSVNESQPTTFFTVGKRDVTTGGKRNLLDGLTSRQEVALASGAHTLFGGTVLTGGSAATNQELQMSLFNGASSAIYINSSLDVSGNAGTNAITSLGIGRDTDASDHFDGKYQELILYPSNQSTNRTGIETNINANYQIYWDGSQTSLLDTYSGSAAAYSLRALSSAYTGPLIRVRRASDNAEQDIYAKYDGTLNVEALQSFCSGTNGFVKTWYDQSGNGYDASQTTAANQPQIVSSGSVILENGKPALQFDGSGDVLDSTISGMRNFTNLSSFIINVPTNASQPDVSTSSLLWYADAGATPITANGLQWGLATGSLSNETYTMYFANDFIGGRLGSSTYSHNANEQIINSVFNLSSGSSAYKNGSQITLNLSSGSISTSTNTSPSNCTIARDDIQLSRGVNQKYQEAIFYPSDQSSNRTGIETNINDFYSIY